MSSVDLNSAKPTEIVLREGRKEEIANMLNYRWKHGWKLDRIIDHGVAPTSHHVPLVIYYFVRL